MYSSVSLITITESSVEQRVDNFLFKSLKGVPKSHIYRLIRTGQVRINKKRTKPHNKLRLGDIVRIPPINLEPREPAPSGHPKFNQAWFSRHTLFEDKDILILAKPSGLAVHAGSGIKHGLIELLRASKEHASDYYELVHRLDRETSGCLIIAKKRFALKALHEQLVLGQIKKIYHALVRGYLSPKQQKVDFSLHKNVLASGERIVTVNPREGKHAVTLFKTLKQYDEVSLVQASPVTGRTHQIRVHAQALGHSIVGDEKYGEKQTNKDFKKRGMGRLFLHAAKLSFLHPRDNKEISVECPLPEELAQCLRQLENH